jgi:hypothetical protein
VAFFAGPKKVTKETTIVGAAMRSHVDVPLLSITAILVRLVLFQRHLPNERGCQPRQASESKKAAGCQDPKLLLLTFSPLSDSAGDEWIDADKGGQTV